MGPQARDTGGGVCAMSSSVRLATRGSELALAQTRAVARLLREAHPGLETLEEIFRTAGDRNLEADLAVAGAQDKGLFTKELELALLDGRADAAVHSLKDLPVSLPSGLALGAILPRADAADVLVSAAPGGLDALVPGARVGTGSPRRRAMLLAARPDVAAAPIRGNVPTRLAKLGDGAFDAIILAAAGLDRLGLPSRGTIAVGGRGFHASKLDGFLPAPGQGAVAVEMRAGDESLAALLRPLHDEATALAVRAERTVLEALGGGCHMALGARAWIEGDALKLGALVFDGPGLPPKYACVTGSTDDPESLGRDAAAKLHEA